MPWLGSSQVLCSFLPPCVLTIKTFWLVNTEHITAFGAFPLFFFGSYEMPYAEFFNALEVIDHAHAVLGSIPLIQVLQPVAGEAVTTKTVLDFSVHHRLTVLDSTCYAGFRFEAVIALAAGAWFLISCVCAAKAAIHSAGSDPLRGNCRFIYRSFWCHVNIPQRTCECLLWPQMGESDTHSQTSEDHQA